MDRFFPSVAEDPVVARIQLGITLRELRERAERTAAEASAHLGCSPAKMSLVENGKQGIGADEVASLLEYYDADEGATAAAVRLAAIPWPKRRGRRRALYEDAFPRAARRYVALEAEASEVVAYSNAIVDDLLQTPEYARTLLKAATPYAGSQEIDVKLDVRMNRGQQLLRDDRPLRLDVILDEACLHRVIGDMDVMCVQFEYLLEMSERDNVRLQIRPYAPSPTPNHDEAFDPQSAFRILKLPERGSLAYFENFAGGNYIEDGILVQDYAAAYERLRRASLDQSETHDYLSELVSRNA